MEYAVKLTDSPEGYIVEARFDLSAFSLGYFPVIGDYLPLFVNVADHDPRDGEDSRSLIAFIGGATDNQYSLNGGYVVFPAKDTYIFGNVPMQSGAELDIAGLHVTAYNGLHGGIPNRIFEVLCQNGLKIMHTGDNQTSQTLPLVDDLDILLLNGWVNESGTASSLIGMRNSINKLQPALTIPGHYHEFMHDAPRFPTYQTALEADDVPLPSKVQVMAWGERYFFAKGNATPILQLFPPIERDSNTKGRTDEQ